MDFDTIILEFNRQYSELKKYGLQVHGVAHLIADEIVISITTPFIFDRTKLPTQFMGLHLRDSIPENLLPIEFQNIDDNKEYIWAYQRFEEYVEKYADTIKNTLGNIEMTREQMLNALCFGDFKKHKDLCIKWEHAGTIPKWTSQPPTKICDKD